MSRIFVFDLNIKESNEYYYGIFPSKIIMKLMFEKELHIVVNKTGFAHEDCLEHCANFLFAKLKRYLRW